MGGCFQPFIIIIRKKKYCGKCEILMGIQCMFLNSLIIMGSITTYMYVIIVFLIYPTHLNLPAEKYKLPNMELTEMRTVVHGQSDFCSDPHSEIAFTFLSGVTRKVVSSYFFRACTSSYQFSSLIVPPFFAE
jgi:hypothetical protein